MAEELFKFKIRKAEQGFILTWSEEIEDGKWRMYHKVFQTQGDEDIDEAHAFVNLCWELKDQLCISTSKHNPWELIMQVNDPEND